MRTRLLVLRLYVIVYVNFFVQFFCGQKLIVKLGGTQLQNNSISGTQQQKGWEPLVYCVECNSNIKNDLRKIAFVLAKFMKIVDEDVMQIADI